MKAEGPRTLERTTTRQRASARPELKCPRGGFPIRLLRSSGVRSLTTRNDDCRAAVMAAVPGPSIA